MEKIKIDITEEQFREVATNAYQELKGFPNMKIALFEDGGMSEKMSLNSYIYDRDSKNMEDPSIIYIYGWNPLDLEGVYDESPDGEKKEGYYWFSGLDEFDNAFYEWIDEWVSNDVQSIKDMYEFAE